MIFANDYSWMKRISFLFPATLFCRFVRFEASFVKRLTKRLNAIKKMLKRNVSLKTVIKKRTRKS